jgi:hypothetical protein
VKDTFLCDWIVSEMSALGVTGADFIAANNRIEDIENDVQIQSEKLAIVVVNALR